LGRAPSVLRQADHVRSACSNAQAAIPKNERLTPKRTSVQTPHRAVRAAIETHSKLLEAGHQRAPIPPAATAISARSRNKRRRRDAISRSRMIRARKAGTRWNKASEKVRQGSREPGTTGSDAGVRVAKVLAELAIASYAKAQDVLGWPALKS